jgi:hypothetical protein
LEERIAMVLVFHAILAFISISGILKSKTMFNLSQFEKNRDITNIFYTRTLIKKNI